MCKSDHLRLFFHVFLAIFLTLSSYMTWMKVKNIPEIPWGCDQFGHLRIAQEIRKSIREHQLPEFRMIHPQIQTLIHWFQATQAPVFQWEEIVAPHAHHYVARNQSVIDQYPPGTGILMGLFPEGKGISYLNQLTIFGMWIFGVALLFFTWAKKAWVSAGMMTLSTFYTIQILDIAKISNYSVNAMILPIFLTALFSKFAQRLYTKGTPHSTRFAFFLAALAGAAAGFSCLVRSPNQLIVAGWLFFLPPQLWISFGIGGVLFGFIPLAGYQYSTTGAWWATTYASVDAALPNWKAIGPNIRFYLIRGEGRKYFFLPLIIGLSYFAWTLHYRFLFLRSAVLQIKEHLVSKSHSSKYRSNFIENRTVGWTFGWMWGLSALYFFTHNITVDYYLVPAHLTVCWLFTVSLLFQETDLLIQPNPFTMKPIKKSIYGKLSLLALLSCLVLGVRYLWQFSLYLRKVEAWPEPISMQNPYNSENLPKELLESHAWIWSDLTSGAFWSVGHKPAFRIRYRGSFQLRSQLYTELNRRGDTQYLVMDGPTSDELLVEFKTLGARLENRGKVFNNLYFKIHFPTYP